MRAIYARFVALSPGFRRFLGCSIILLLCMLAYLPAMQGKFLWDDLYLVGMNPLFRSPRFLIEVFRHYLYVDSFSAYYRPIQNVSYILDYWIWDRQEFGYHLSNVLFHAASAILLYFVLHQCLRRLAAPSPAFAEGASFSVALLWAVHPVHNAAVAYVAGRADSLAMMFALAGWLLFTTEAVGWRRILAALLAPLCFLAALCSKEIAFVWIALFLVYLFAFERDRALRAKLRITGSLLAALGFYLMLRHMLGHRSPQQSEIDPLAERVILAFRALGQYTALLFYPANLHMERTLWTGPDFATLHSWTDALRGDWLSLLGLLTIALFAFACWCPLPGRRIRIFGVTWFVLGFLPISNLFSLNSQVAEHWIYLASAGYILMLAGFACALPRQHRRLLAFAVPALVAVLAVRTACRAADWADPEAFFKQTIAAGGASDRASLSLAKVYSDRGDIKKSEAVLIDALRRYPGYTSARINLGIDLANQGRNAAAQSLLKLPPADEAQAAAYVPRTWTAALNLAHIQYNTKHPDAALAILDDALKRYPDTWDLICYRAQILWITKDAAAALPAVRQYAAAHWWHYDSHLMLGQLLASAGRYEEGVAVSRDAATLDIHSPTAFEDIARASLRANRLPEALEAQADAIERSPGAPHEYKIFAAILTRMHQPADASAALHKAELLSVN
ncbi:MAG: tetratricopeptide repeat protein [Chthoniobacteraceae bacterium]